MSVLILPSRWQVQPQGPVEIDWSHRLAKGLVYFAIGNDVNAPDLVSGELGSPINTSRIVAGPYGRGFNASASGGAVGWSHPLNDTIKTITTDFTMAVQCDLADIPNNCKILTVPYHFNTYNAPYFSLAMGRSGSGSRMAVYGSDNTSTNMALAPGDNVFPLASRQTIIATRSGTNCAFYRNGVNYSLGVNSFTANPILYGTGDKVCLLNRSARTPGESSRGFVYWAGLWNRSLSEAETTELYRNPYQIIKPQSTALYYIGASIPAGNRAAPKPTGALSLSKTGQMSNCSGYWAFNEGSGTSSANLADPGTGNATIQAGASYGSDDIGGYLSGSRVTNSYAATGLTATALGIGGTTAKTTFCRFVADTQAFANDPTLGTNTGALYYCGSGTTNGAWGFRQSSPTSPASDLWISNVNGSPAPADITITPTMGTLHTVVMTWDGTTNVRVYVDGALVQTFATSIDTGDDRTFDIGRMLPNSGVAADRWHFDGRIYEVGVIAGEAWDDAEVAAYDDNPLMGLSVSSATTGTSSAILPFPTTAASGSRAIPDRTATSAAALPALTGTASATRTIPARTATSASTLPNAATASTATRTIPNRTATSTATTPTVTSAATAVRAIPDRTATSSAALPLPASDASGESHARSFSYEFSSEFLVSSTSVGGPSASTLPEITTAATGARTLPGLDGASAVTLPALTSTATGARTIPDRTAASASTLPAVTSAASATRTIPARTATGTAVLPTVTSAATAARTIPDRTATSSATLPLTDTVADAARTIPDRTAASSNVVPFPSTAAAATRGIPDRSGLSASTVPNASTATTATRTIPDIDGTSSGTLQPLDTNAVAARTLPGMDGSIAVTLPKIASAGTASRTVPQFPATSAATLPRPTVAGTGARTIPNRTATSNSDTPGVVSTASGARTIPPNTATSAVTLPKPTSTAAATRLEPVTGTAAASLPKARTEAAAEFSIPDITATSSTTLPKIRTAATAARLEPGTAGSASTLPKVQSTATGTRTIPDLAGTSASVIPFPRSSATAFRQPLPEMGESAITLPSVFTVSVGQVDVPLFAGTSPSVLPKVRSAADGFKVGPPFPGESSATLPRIGTLAQGHFINPGAADVTGAVYLTGTVVYDIDLTGEVVADIELQGEVKVA